MTFKLDEYIPFLMYRVAYKIGNTANADLKKFGINMMCSRILLTLQRNAAARQAVTTVGDLCAATSIDQSTVSHTLIKLSRAGLISKERQPHDNRSVRVSLTGKGKEAADRCAEIALRYDDVALKGLSREQLTALKAMLRQLYDNIADLETLEAPPKAGRERRPRAARSPRTRPVRIPA